ncbi:DUF499 domain-containing protein, partial [candidate division KSB3 bacterium]|nr:DUF499 domain-containing protein [candidate division KSB3 bacterium]MBD3323180.1 DUF499 domain-containing protein [candidate division KSB3 bacterium]
MLLKPWYDVIHPRTEICQNTTPDLLEFTVHAAQVQAGQALEEYGQPDRFFTQTALSKALLHLATDVVRRLSAAPGETTAVVRLDGRTGEGKTHAVALLYHLMRHGSDSHTWPGVSKMLTTAGVPTIPTARTVLVSGTQFEPAPGNTGRRGKRTRKTLWGEMAFQLGGKAAFATVADADERLTTPDPEIIRALLPDNAPCLILIDDLLPYISRYRATDMAEQVYRFLETLAEQVRHLTTAVLVVTVPTNPPDIPPEDRQHLDRYATLLEQVGKPLALAQEKEIASILRRRLFRWPPEALSREGEILLPHDALETCMTYADWVNAHRSQLPSWFPFDQAESLFRAAYPFHPSAISVFERKWQSLPYFQHIRGILRLFALSIANAYQEGYSRVYSDPLIGLGTAPLDNMEFRDTVLTQLGEDDRLEHVIQTDLYGREAFAAQLDSEASDEIKHNRLHQKAATAIFFESNGGVSDPVRVEATESEIRLAIEEPEVETGDLETVLAALEAHCYYLIREDKQYRFRLIPNLNKLVAEYSPTIDESRIDDRIRHEITQAFANSSVVTLFPEHSRDIPDRPQLTLAVLAPEHMHQTPQTTQMIEAMITTFGAKPRRFQSAIIWVVAENPSRLHTE